MPTYNYQCGFCGTHFVTEDRFIKHRCKSMIRDDEFRTVEGQAAWLYYKAWMKAYRRIVPKDKAYLKSKFFNSFMRFAVYVKKMKIPDTDAFIWLMKEKDISPTIWTNDQVYTLYLEFMDRKVSPKRHAEITINTLFDEADERQISVGDIFDNITATELIQLMHRRQVSPWFLLNSHKFKQFFINSTSTEEKIIMESIIRPQYWKTKFDNNPESIKNIQIYIKELNL